MSVNALAKQPEFTNVSPKVPPETPPSAVQANIKDKVVQIKPKSEVLPTGKLCPQDANLMGELNILWSDEKVWSLSAAYQSVFGGAYQKQSHRPLDWQKTVFAHLDGMDAITENILKQKLKTQTVPMGLKRTYREKFWDYIQEKMTNKVCPIATEAHTFAMTALKDMLQKAKPENDNALPFKKVQ